MWCHSGPAPKPVDCVELYDRVDLWLQDFLDTPDVPMAALNTFPKECSSVCNP
jgi:hypothetical protein